MSNMWKYIVGVVLAAGAGIALYNAVGEDGATVSASPPPARVESATSASASEMETVAQAPAPEQEFGDIAVTADDFVIGEASAPVTIIEYASLSCPHCAAFHNQVLPTLKKDYIDTGKVRLVYRDYPHNNAAVAATMMARCAPRERFLGIVDLLFRSQDQWALSPDPEAGLSRVARLAGMSDQAFGACLKNEPVLKGVIERRSAAANQYNISSIPTLIVNGKKYAAGLSLGDIKAIIESMLPKS